MKARNMWQLFELSLFLDFGKSMYEDVEVVEVWFGLVWKALNPVQSVSHQGRYRAAKKRMMVKHGCLTDWEHMAHPHKSQSEVFFQI